MPKLTGWLYAITAVFLAACGGSTSSPHVDSCFVEVFPPYPLIYPMPNTTGAPDGNFILFVAVPNGDPTPGALELQNPISGTTEFTSGAWSPAAMPLPSPAATMPPNSSAYGTAVPQLSQNTSYSVNFATYPQPPGCPVDALESFETH